MRYLLMNYLIKALFSMEVSKQNQTNIFSYQTYMIFALEKHLSLIDYNFIKKMQTKNSTNYRLHVTNQKDAIFKVLCF